LMMLSSLDIKNDEKNISQYIKKNIMPFNQIKEVKEYQKVIDEVNFGGLGLFVDGMDSAITADVKGWGARGVERPNTELVIRGPQEGFNETVRTNTALIRKRLKDEDLIVENLAIGERSKTPVSMLYIKDIANESLVSEVRRRLKSIKIDYLQDSGELEQYIEDSTFMPAPQITATERPDRVAASLTEGKVSVIVHGSPFALVMPVTMHTLVQSPEDAYVRFPYGNLLRAVRVIGILFSLLLPGIYVAITNFHHEMIPTDLLFAIEAAREKVPFPSVVEILIMEFAFELIREAGIRIPGPIGPTLGIIGALILGQAAVAANRNRFLRHS
jgi:spore germination protein KA